MTEQTKPIPPALCLVRRDFVYAQADSHLAGSDEFRKRQIARGMRPRERRDDERRAA